MQRMGAFKGGLDRSSQRKMKTINVDLLDWIVLDNNGHRYSLTRVVLVSAFPALALTLTLSLDTAVVWSYDRILL